MRRIAEHRERGVNLPFFYGLLNSSPMKNKTFLPTTSAWNFPAGIANAFSFSLLS